MDRAADAHPAYSKNKITHRHAPFSSHQAVPINTNTYASYVRPTFELPSARGANGER